jgi:hypothetical protein
MQDILWHFAALQLKLQISKTHLKSMWKRTLQGALHGVPY